MNESLQLELKDLSGLPEVARALLNFAGPERIFLFDAAMGAGKTTLIKEMCRQLGCTDALSSPTYSIVNEYNSPTGKIYHFDLYRLKDQEELLDLGIEDYLDGKHYCFLEWPELAENFLAGNYVKILIHVNENIRYIRAVLV